MSVTPAELAARFRQIRRERMQGLPFLNNALDVEAVGFRPHGEHCLGVLVTPWFMNLVLLPGDEQWDGHPLGNVVSLSLPGGPCEFTVNRDDVLGTFLTAVLYREVGGIPDQPTARALACDIIGRLCEPAEGSAQPQRSSGSRRRLSRRELLGALRTD